MQALTAIVLTGAGPFHQHDSGKDQDGGQNPHQSDALTQVDDTHDKGPDRTDSGPDRVCCTKGKGSHSEREQDKASHRGDESHRASARATESVR